MSHYRFISMLIGLGVLGACNDPDERRVNAQNDNGGDLSMSVDGGNKSAGKISPASRRSGSARPRSISTA